MNFFEKNQNYLKKAKAAFAIGNEKAFAPEDDAIYKKQDGHYRAERKGVSCFVHSRYSMPDEIKSMFEKAPQDAQCIMLLGCGLGAAVRYALDPHNFPELKTLIIMEPSPAWASLVMNDTDMETAWGENPEKIYFFVGYRPDMLSTIMAAGAMYIQDSLFTANHLSVHTLFFDYYQELTSYITDKLRNVSVILNTNKKILHRRVYNEVLNLAQPSYSFTDMMDLFKGKNVIIVAAGPSLEKNIHLLEEAKKKAVIVAVGSAIRILDARGIIPHACMALDPFPAEHKVFGNFWNESVPLIYTTALYTEILSCYKGPLVRINGENDTLSIFLHEKKKGETMSFDTGPSIANLAAETFCAAGCKTMAFVGQDMCMYNYRIHADTGEFLPYKNMDDSRFLLNLKDIDGNNVVSPRNYYMIKERLEVTIARFYGKVKFVNATEGGLGLYGVPNKPLADVLAAWEDDDIAPVMAERLKKSELIDFQDELYALRKKIGDICSLNNENLENLQKVKNAFLKDERLMQREKYVRAVAAAQKKEKELKKINWHLEYIQPLLEIFLQADCMQWEKGIDSADEKIRLRSIIEIQLATAQATKSLTIVLGKALDTVFSEEIRTKTFSLTVK